MRRYEETHPWLTYRLDLGKLTPDMWLLLGECYSKCQHLAGSPLRPNEAAELNEVYLVKGALATTAIEGNTLTERQVRDRIEGQLKLPLSQEYLGVEIDNVAKAFNSVFMDAYIRAHDGRLTPEHLRALHAMVMEGIDHDDHVVAGQFRTTSVGVANYIAPHAEDVPFLADRLCSWTEEVWAQRASHQDGMRFALIVTLAVLTHLYIAWIHPFGDGNGRTARMAEFEILVAGGLPLPAAHLLSDHYNKTRSKYYSELDRASKGGGDPVPFLRYALQGLVDGLREQIEVVRSMQWQVAWENYVHDQFRDEPDTPAMHRRKHLVLDMGSDSYPKQALRSVSPRVASDYAGKGPKVLSRDITDLKAKKLIRSDGGRLRANRQIILAFLPPAASNAESNIAG